MTQGGGEIPGGAPYLTPGGDLYNGVYTVARAESYRAGQEEVE